MKLLSSLTTLFSKREHILLAVILVVASFTRLWNLPASLEFLGDQGRDAIIVSDIFMKLDPVFIGPVTSVGNMYLGPLYYYFMAPFLLLSFPSPVGPAYAVAVLGIVTVFLVYWWGRSIVGEHAALFAAALMAISETAVQYTRFSWNPNPAPLVGLVMMFATWKAWKQNQWWWAVVATCFSILIQLHYVTLLSAGGAGLIWLYSLYQNRTKNRRSHLKKQVLATFLGLGIFIVSLTPLMLFDSRHNWLNAKAFQNMLFGTEESFARETDTLISKIPKTLKETHGRGMHLMFEITIGQQRTLNTVLLVAFLSMLLLGTYQQLQSEKKSRDGQGLVVLSAYLFTGILGLSLYEHSVFDHYFAYLFPATFLTLGYGLNLLCEKNMAGKIAATAFVIGFAGYNLPRLPLQAQSWGIYDVQEVSDTILNRVEPGEKYNIVLLSSSGDIDGQNYRYFLHVSEKPPVPTEERGSIEKLFIINEDLKIDKVTDSPVYEIVVFPDKEPKEVYTIPGGPEITVLEKFVTQDENTQVEESE